MMPNDPYINVPFPLRVPSAFLIKRVHSITGIFFVFFLIEHLITNSESGLFFGEDGASFIRSANFLESLPYLPLVELFLLGIPIAIHAILGTIFLFTCVHNCLPSDGSTPSIYYSRNIFFTLQRVTAAFLLIGITAHVITMRFVNKPYEIDQTGKFYVRVSSDKGLLTLAARLKAIVVTQDSKDSLLSQIKKQARLADQEVSLHMQQRQKEDLSLLSFLRKESVDEHSWIVLAPSFGTACLLLVRDTFKSWYMCALYTLFVFMAAFHASNGLWTFCITWGITQNEQGRMYVRLISLLLLSLFISCGVVSIFSTYFLNLYS